MSDNKKNKNCRALKAAMKVTAVLLCLLLLTLCACDAVSSTSYNTYEYSSSVQYFLPQNTDAQLSAPVVSAEGAILIEASTGEVIWAKNSNARLPMASTTKIMTAFVAIENGDINKTVSVSPDAVGIEGSSVYLYSEEKLTLSDLLYAMMLESANDAAAAIAIEIGGSISSFAQLMNKKADELGLEHTHFTNPHGLDDPEHYTTANDLARIACAAMKNETFRSIVSTYKKTIPLNETEGVRLLINHNKMLSRYDGAVGIKTGYTKKSGRCLVSAAEKDGVELICVTLNAPDDWNDHTKILNYGFSMYESITLYQANEVRIIQPIVGGDQGYVTLTNMVEVRITVPKDTDKLRCLTCIPRFTYAPIKKGDIVGSLLYTYDGTVIAEIPIIAEYSVDRTVYKKNFFEKILQIFN